MLKLARRARGHFVTLIEIRVHLIRVKPGHISSSGVQNRASKETGDSRTVTSIRERNFSRTRIFLFLLD